MQKSLGAEKMNCTKYSDNTIFKDINRMGLFSKIWFLILDLVNGIF